MGWPSPWSNQIISTLILVTSSGGFGGIYFYSPSPGVGKLILAVGAASSTDPFGNPTIVGGITVGSNASNTPQLDLIPAPGGPTNPAKIQFTMWPTANWSNQPNIAGGGSFASGGTLIISGPAITGLNLQDWLQLIFWADNSTTPAHLDTNYIDASAGVHTYQSASYYGIRLQPCDTLVARKQNTGTSPTNPAALETWHSATLINSWTGSGGGVNGLWYRLLPFGDGLLEVIADVINTTATGNSICFQVPYFPGISSNHPAGWNHPQLNNSATVPWIFVDTSGNIQITGIQVANVGIFFHIFIPLTLIN